MKKHLLSLFLLAFAIACSKDEDPTPSLGSWQQLNDFPGEGRNDGISFSLLGKGYWGLGNNGSGYVRDMWAYDPATDSWTEKNDFPFDIPAVAAAAVNDKGYMISYFGTLYEYNPVTDTWKLLSTFPGGYRPGMTGFALGGDLYFGTGNNVDVNNFQTFKDFWRYDIAENKWTAIADFPGVSRTNAISFIVGDKAYVGLGFNGIAAPPIYKDMWSYDAKTGDWTQIADLPENNTIVGILFSNAKKGYVGVYESNETHRGIVYEFDPSANVWRKVKMFPSGSSLNTESFFVNNRSFVFGGWWSETSLQVWEFVP